MFLPVKTLWSQKLQIKAMASTDGFHTGNTTLNGIRWSETSIWSRNQNLKSKPLGKAAIQQHDTNDGRKHSKVTSAIICE